MTAMASAHELRAVLRKARIQIAIQEKQLEALRACLRGEHHYPLGSTGSACFICSQVAS